MKPHRLLTALLLAAGLLAGASAQSVRPEVGKPLQQAGDLLRAGKAKEALAKVREADAVSGKTPAEQVMIDRMKGAAAQRAGDNAAAAQAFEAVFASGKLAGPEQAQIAESLAFTYSQMKNWAKSSEWAQKAQAHGANSPQLRQLQTFLMAQSGDFSGVAKEAAAAVAAAEQAGRRPAEDDLLRLADAQQRTKNAAGQSNTMEKLLANYPKKEYWNDMLVRIQRKPGFSADRLALDVYRLQLATGNLTKTNDYMEMAQLALQAGNTAEAKKIVDKGFAANLLGTGAEADRHKRLRDLALKQDAEAKAKWDADIVQANSDKDGNLMVQLGYAQVSAGQADAGLKLIEQGIAKDKLKRPEDAKLHLGIAQLLAGKKAKAQQTLRSVGGTDGTADLARLWIIQSNQGNQQ
ncbi:MAG: hypothetical protein E6H79_01520 [Betaproteobacteria bacterium]|nr:MAG: hypothetical protein E6H79_01520 [Betaproteobacteria bacterium]